MLEVQADTSEPLENHPPEAAKTPVIHTITVRERVYGGMEGLVMDMTPPPGGGFASGNGPSPFPPRSSADKQQAVSDPGIAPGRGYKGAVAANHLANITSGA
jgi:hypothetical protein